MSGTTLPDTLITGPATGFGTNSADAVALDPRGRTYATTGNAAPDNMIGGAATGLANPTALAVDQADPALRSQ